MENHLLIRAYRVGCGDCIYVRIPQGDDGFHILIDCGKKGGDELLEQAIRHLEAEVLPPGDAPGKKRLDLIVATHRHEDHIKGFDEEWFKNIQVKNVWLSAAMDPDHPQAKEKANKLHAFAQREMRRLGESGRALSPQVQILVSAYGVSNDAADDFLMKTLAEANHITPQFVHAGQTSKQLGLDLKDATIHVLAPEEDIDGFYLGSDFDPTLKSFQEGVLLSENPRTEPVETPAPKNIGAGDFRRLQSGMLSNSLAFAAKDTTIQNNMSVVLLIEWKGRRLLFVGDAEWDREFKAGKDNGSWNVMWEKRRDHLTEPLDFLKIGHHGSINATPPILEKQPQSSAKLGEKSIYRLLDSILPRAEEGKKPTAQAIVSTEREFYETIPDCAVLADLARRVSNTRNYDAELKEKLKDPRGIWVSAKAKKNKFFETFEEKFLNLPQPHRTDLEFELDEKFFVDVKVLPEP